MPRTFRQYLRAVLLPFRLTNEAAYRLALKEVRTDDTFLCSFPKSGNTWLRLLLAHLLSDSDSIGVRTVDQIIPDLYRSRKFIDTIPSSRFIKIHEPWFHLFPKTIYLVRDVRDVYISYYHYLSKLGKYTGDLVNFIKMNSNSASDNTWAMHVQAALLHQKKNVEKIIIIRYEDLLTQPEIELQRIVDFLAIIPKHTILESIENCRFDRLKQQEIENGSIFRDLSGGHFFREGRAGGWKGIFGEAEQQALSSADREMLALLGYID